MEKVNWAVRAIQCNIRAQQKMKSLLQIEQTKSDLQWCQLRFEGV